MPKFLTLHLYETNEPFLVNVASVQAVLPLRGHSIVIVGPEQHTEVFESVAQIRALLDA